MSDKLRIYEEGKIHALKHDDARIDCVETWCGMRRPGYYVTPVGDDEEVTCQTCLRAKEAAEGDKG